MDRAENETHYDNAVQLQAQSVVQVLIATSSTDDHACKRLREQHACQLVARCCY